jgi:4-hydroxy-tetrahydrodipicolinate reductase
VAAPARVLVVGACGRMGERVRAALAGEPSLALSAALEAPGHPQLGAEIAPGVVLRDDMKAALRGCDVAIDFSRAAASLALLRAAAEAGVAVVMGTTGLSGDERAELALAARRIAVLHAPNFSPSVNVLAWLVREAARRLGPGYDAEIVELHHAGKRDAPSGTALRLAEAIAEGRGHPLEGHLVLERAGETGARPAGAIGIQALRAGDSAGDHTVLFAGEGERLELVHRSQTRDHFARGAVRAAAWLAGRPAGLYRIEQVLGLDA